MSTVEVQLARREWEEGKQRFDEDAHHDPRLLPMLDTVVDELRRRVGQTYTLAELASAYEGAEDWGRVVVADFAPFPGWPRRLTNVLDAAFHLYSRGATDYRP